MCRPVTAASVVFRSIPGRARGGRTMWIAKSVFPRGSTQQAGLSRYPLHYLRCLCSSAAGWISCFACALVLVAWIRSSFRHDFVSVAGTASWTAMVESGCGTMRLGYVRGRFARPVDALDWDLDSHSVHACGEWTPGGLLHFRWTGVNVAYGMAGILEFPYWALFAPALAIHIVLIRLRVRVLAAASAFFCERCAYDLTGNVSGVCPECGTAKRRNAESRNPENAGGWMCRALTGAWVLLSFVFPRPPPWAFMWRP